MFYIRNCSPKYYVLTLMSFQIHTVFCEKNGMLVTCKSGLFWPLDDIWTTFIMLFWSLTAHFFLTYGKQRPEDSA